ncbi:helix-turn-helix domain-containing protein [Microvirga alba]|uniref:Chromosomal replication initiator DnaA C-terminal domain-containing protein n=1 Tax=Microvirga alba TaxID=2791025 RepID=A0A931BPQ1_9HYPH|nr:helix-turn-helix domain-containing protein [Microvirga alba]MBF9234701.1 hypothetical protein [Microvirga alba]
MAGFTTLARPRPVFNQRPAMPVVPFERVGRAAPVIPVALPPPVVEVRQPTVAELLDNFRLVCSSEAAPRLTMHLILEHVAAGFQVTTQDLKNERRTMRVVQPRQAFMYLARDLTGKSYPSIGRVIGGKDHTTIIKGATRCESRMAADPDYRLAVLTIKKRLEVLA